MSSEIVEQLIVFVIAFFPLTVFLIQTGTRKYKSGKKTIPTIEPVEERRIRVRTKEEIQKEIDHDWENKLRRAKGLPALPLPDELAWIYSDDDEILCYGPKSKATLAEVEAKMRPMTPNEKYKHTLSKMTEQLVSVRRPTSLALSEEEALDRANKRIAEVVDTLTKPETKKLPRAKQMREARTLIESVRDGYLTRNEAREQARKLNLDPTYYNAVDLGVKNLGERYVSRYAAPKDLTGNDLKRWAWKLYQVVDTKGSTEPHQRYSHFTNWIGEQQCLGRITSTQYFELMEYASRQYRDSFPKGKEKPPTFAQRIREYDKEQRKKQKGEIAKLRKETLALEALLRKTEDRAYDR